MINVSNAVLTRWWKAKALLVINHLHQELHGEKAGEGVGESWWYRGGGQNAYLSG